MTNFFIKLHGWFKPKSAQPRKVLRPKLKLTKPAIKPKANLQPFNEQHYRQLVGQIAKRTIAYQRNKPERRRY